MPEPERTAVREAALWWNRAFEEAGFRDALVIRDLPDGATFLDARYSGIEWINRAERAWSIGDFQADPRTGEILHAVARIDSHRRRTTVADVAQHARPAARAGRARTWTRQAFVLQRAALPLRARGGPHHRPDAQLGRHHLRLGLGDGLPRAQRRSSATASSTSPTPIRRTSGSYDRLAIRWGYTPDAGPATLDAIVREGYARGIVYPLDDDPRWAEYDWGPDPVAWLRTTQDVRRVILSRFGPGQLAPGELALRPAGALQPRLPVPSLRHPGRAAVRGRAVPDQRGEGRRPDADGLGAGGASSARRSTC